MARNQHIIMLRLGMLQRHQPHRFAQAAFGRITIHRAAKLLGSGKAKAGKIGLDRMIWATPGPLHNKTMRHKFVATASGGQKIPTVFDGMQCSLSGELVTAFSTTCVDDFASTHGCHARAKAMTALAYNIAGLISAFHGDSP
jgi:hypothetical protein